MSNLEICRENKIIEAIARKLDVKYNDIIKIEYDSNDYDGEICMDIDVYLKNSNTYIRLVADWDEINFSVNKLPKNIVVQ